MRTFSFAVLTVFVILIALTHAQTPYDPNKEYNFTWITSIPYNPDVMQLCVTPSADGTHCEKCIHNLTANIYGTNLWTPCQLSFPPDNCYAYDYCYNCLLCHDGFWRNETINDINYCIPKTRGCLTYDSVNKKCVTCSPGWTMNTTVNMYSNLTEYYCYFVADANCLSYDTSNNCQQCATSYVLVNNKCVNWVANCDVMNGTKCAKCKQAYQLDFNGNCTAIPTIANCYQQVDSQCQSCVVGYRLQNNSCVFVIDNCVKVTRTVCLQCNNGFYIGADGKCLNIPRIVNCDVQSEFACVQCVAGYYVTADSKCAVIPHIVNCEIQAEFTCSKCRSGYAVSIDGNCAIILRIANCDIQSEFTCTKCSTGYSLSFDGKCVPIARIPNCQVQSDFTCNKCVPGYFITTDNKCEAIPHIANCQLQTDFTCTQCLTGYTLSSNNCIVIISNCLQFTGITCTKCVDGYAPTSTGQCASIPKVTNCLLQMSTTCTRCLTGYDLVNGYCIYHIDNCQKVNNTTCAQCIDGYSLNSNKCTPFDPFASFDPNCRLYDNTVFTKCLTCSGGFFINGKGLCEQTDPLCKSYSSNNGLCLSCYVGFTLDSVNGKCLKVPLVYSQSQQQDNCNQYDFVQNVCLKCAEGCYFDVSGKCQKFNDVNCKTPSIDLKSCSQCYKGYNFDTAQAKCVVGNYNCATWNNGRCATCPQGYSLDGTSNCTLVDQYCKIFNQQLKTCILCYPGYAMDTDKRCKQISLLSTTVQKQTLNCATFNDKGQCTDCYFGYFVVQDLTGYYCQKVSDLCRSYSKLTGKCTSCYLGYYLSTQGECLKFF